MLEAVLVTLTRRVRALVVEPSPVLAAAEAAEGELYRLYGLSVALQRDLGPEFQDLGETRLEAARALRAWVKAPRDAPFAEFAPDARLALSRVVRLVQDYPFCFTATNARRKPHRFPTEEAARAWALDFTLAYPDLPGALTALFEDSPRRLARTLLAMRDRLDGAQRAAWAIRRAARARRPSK